MSWSWSRGQRERERKNFNEFCSGKKHEKREDFKEDKNGK